MKTDKFMTSIVFPNGAASGRPMLYNEATQSELPCTVFPHRGGGNMALFENCHFTVYLNKNSKLISGEDIKNGQHVVTNDQENYVLDVYLQVDGDVITNHIALVSPLPEGIIMNSMKESAGVDVFVFSGFSVILFDIKKESF
jgi:hypothetical protein